MDDAKKLLDSLMGQTRDIPLKEAKKKKGSNFKADNACKFYLIGFCPQQEQLFRNTKRHLGECEKVHSDALKEEFEACPERLEHETKYVRDLVRYMESIVRTADEAVSRQARNIQAANKELEERGPNDVAKREIEKIRENCNVLLNEAEELAEAGDIEGSKQKQAIFEQTKAKADDYEAKSKQPIKEEVCSVCGLRPEDGDGMRKFSHTEGKIHIGFVKVREWLKIMKEKQDKWDEERKEKRAGDDEKRKDRKEREGEKDEKEDTRTPEEKEAARAERTAVEKSRQDEIESDNKKDRDGGRDRDRRDRRGGDRDGDREARGSGGDRGYDRGRDRRGGRDGGYEDSGSGAQFEPRGGRRGGDDRGRGGRSRSRGRGRY